jgi:hypothetical protein
MNMDKLLLDGGADALRKDRAAAEAARSRTITDTELRKLGEARQLERLPHSVGSALTKAVRNHTVEIDGRVTILSHDVAGNSINIGGVNLDLAEYPKLRSELEISGAALDRAQTIDEQTTAREAISAAIRAALADSKYAGATVRERIAR